MAKTENILRGVLVVVLIVALFSMFRTCDVVSETEQRSREANSKALIHEEHDMQSKTTSWCYEVSPGVTATFEVRTVRNDGESLEDWCARHEAAVDAAMKKHPPVPCK